MTARSCGSEFIEIVARDRIETGACLKNIGKAVAVGDQKSLVNSISEADERRKFIPCQRGTTGAKLHLIGVILAELRFKDTVYAFVGTGQSQLLLQRMGNTRSRPDILRSLDSERSEVSLDEDFKDIATLLLGTEAADACFQFADAC